MSEKAVYLLHLISVWRLLNCLTSEFKSIHIWLVIVSLGKKCNSFEYTCMMNQGRDLRRNVYGELITVN